MGASHLAHRATAVAVAIQPPSVLTDLAGTLVGVTLCVALLLIGRVLRQAWRLLMHALARVIPRAIAAALALAAGLALLVVATNEVIVRRGLESIANHAAAVNEEVPDDVRRPTSPGRSGGTGATQPWEALGAMGRKFVSSGPDAALIARVTARPAKDPIRVYGGLGDGLSLDEVLEVTRAELRRTGALDRGTVVVAVTTGRGWVDEFNVQSVEYLTGGDCATIAMQYSYLPSPVAFVVDRDTPPEVGRRLFGMVQAEVARRTDGRRPRVYVTGESLGSYGGHAAFADAADMLRRVDGAVWIGTPRFTGIWEQLTASRDAGSPEVAPVVDGGRHVRFVTRPAELGRDQAGRPFGPWRAPRVTYLQYASDAIVWWSPDLVMRRPDWMREDVGHDVPATLRWLPLVTFLQLTADMAVSDQVPPGHGHIYEDDMVPVWAAVLDAPGLDPGAVAAAIRSYR